MENSIKPSESTQNKGLLPPPTPPSKKQKSDKRGTLRTLQVITVVLLLALIGAGAYIYSITKQSEEEKKILAEEKQVVINDLTHLKGEYETLKTGNDTLNAQLVTERKKIDALLERIKQTEATNKAKIRQYEKEIGNLKSLLVVYVHQIDSLNVLNKELRAENDKVKSEISKSKQKVEQLSQETSTLKSIVEKGGELKTRDISALAMTNRDKVTARARQTDQIKVCLTLIENNIAKRGPRKIHIRIKSPDGSLLTQSVTNVFSPAGGGAQMIYSSTREVEYAGEDLEVCVFYKDKDFLAGTFSIEVYLDAVFTGSTQLILK